MDLIVRDERKSVTLSCPGPGGKGTLSLVIQAKNRRVRVPDITAAVYADALSKLIDAGILIVPGEPPAPDAPAETPIETAEAPRQSRRSRRSSEE